MIAILAVAGCVDDGATAETEQASTTAFANDQAAFNFFIAKGLTNFQAAGIVGNLDQESGVNPASVQSGGPGRGIAQWSVGGRWDTSANDNATSYAASQNEARGTLNLQLEFIWYELSTIGYGFTDLKATTNVTDATVAFMAKYEICGNCVQTQRVTYAKAVLAAYGQIPYGATYVSQSWPLASAPAMTVKCGETVAANIVLKNTGTNAWNSSTALGTTVPRDRTSIFAGADWAAPNRAAKISGTVAPGANGTFTFAFDGPTGAACVPGTYTEHFGIVQDGTAWFSDAGDGGPADDVIAALIDLVPGDGSGSGSDGGGGSDMGGGSDGTGAGSAQNAGCNAGGAGGFGSLLVIGFAAFVRRRRAN
ncbi:MAG TPA: phage tail tip lysozyme [Kofleriaceae bacterium]